MKRKSGPMFNGLVRHQKTRAFTLDDETVEMLDKIAEEMGCGRSHALRLLIRKEWRRMKVRL